MLYRSLELRTDRRAARGGGNFPQEQDLGPYLSTHLDISRSDGVKASRGAGAGRSRESQDALIGTREDSDESCMQLQYRVEIQSIIQPILRLAEAKGSVPVAAHSHQCKVLCWVEHLDVVIAQSRRIPPCSHRPAQALDALSRRVQSQPPMSWLHNIGG